MGEKKRKIKIVEKEKFEKIEKMKKLKILEENKNKKLKNKGNLKGNLKNKRNVSIDNNFKFKNVDNDVGNGNVDNDEIQFLNQVEKVEKKRNDYENMLTDEDDTYNTFIKDPMNSRIMSDYYTNMNNMQSE